MTSKLEWWSFTTRHIPCGYPLMVRESVTKTGLPHERQYFTVGGRRIKEPCPGCGKLIVPKYVLGLREALEPVRPTRIGSNGRREATNAPTD